MPHPPIIWLILFFLIIFMPLGLWMMMSRTHRNSHKDFSASSFQPLHQSGFRLRLILILTVTMTIIWLLPMLRSSAPGTLRWFLLGWSGSLIGMAVLAGSRHKITAISPWSQTDTFDNESQRDFEDQLKIDYQVYESSPLALILKLRNNRQVQMISADQTSWLKTIDLDLAKLDHTGYQAQQALSFAEHYGLIQAVEHYNHLTVNRHTQYIRMVMLEAYRIHCHLLALTNLYYHLAMRRHFRPLAGLLRQFRILTDDLKSRAPGLLHYRMNGDFPCGVIEAFWNWSEEVNNQISQVMRWLDRSVARNLLAGTGRSAPVKESKSGNAYRFIYSCPSVRTFFPLPDPSLPYPKKYDTLSDTQEWDCYSRFRVRCTEIFESLQTIRYTLRQLTRSGEVHTGITTLPALQLLTFRLASYETELVAEMICDYGRHQTWRVGLKPLPIQLFNQLWPDLPISALPLIFCSLNIGSPYLTLSS